MDRSPLIFQPREYDAGASPTKNKRGRQLGALAHILKYFEFQTDQCINVISDRYF
jgi:hypothetical protein